MKSGPEVRPSSGPVILACRKNDRDMPMYSAASASLNARFGNTMVIASCFFVARLPKRGAISVPSGEMPRGWKKVFLGLEKTRKVLLYADLSKRILLLELQGVEMINCKGLG
jgi:hypothetical protein